MKKPTALIGAILSLIPLGQPFFIKTGVFLSTTSMMLFLPEKVNSESSDFYFNRAYEKGERGDHYGAISDYNKAIEIDPNDTDLYVNRGVSKENIGDIKGACVDAKKAVSLGDIGSDNKNWINNNCK
tara:strand:- start:93 stop:473 length:381 start_codon:yes stop_codon:yes gene_type:complete